MQAAANTTTQVDTALLGILIISVVLLVGITAVMIYFAIVYHRSRRPTVENIEGHLGLEIVWTVLPIFIVMWMFYFGYKGYIATRVGPSDALVVTANGVMWAWSFTYPNGATSGEMRLPVNVPIKVVTTSSDVLHSFYVPAFRIKQDAVPGRKNHIFFTPQKEGRYDVFCAEFCGELHSKMLSKVIVMPQDEFNEWYRSKAPKQAAKPQKPILSEKGPTQPEQPTEPEPAAPEATSKGQQIAQAKLCTTCHSTDGSKLSGPSWKGLYGHKVTVLVGDKERSVTADDAYIKKAILEPSAEVVKGYDPVMPAQQLSDADIKAIIDYIKTLK